MLHYSANASVVFKFFPCMPQLQLINIGYGLLKSLLKFLGDCGIGGWCICAFAYSHRSHGVRSGDLGSVAELFSLISSHETSSNIVLLDLRFHFSLIMIRVPLMGDILQCCCFQFISCLYL
jgi:hypothetical protein